MSARVRVEPKTHRLYLDLHIRGQRRKIASHLPDTPRNRTTLEAKAEQIEREMFLGTFDVTRHFPEKSPPATFKQLYEEWKKKKANEVSPLTYDWYREVVEKKILPFGGAKRLADFSHSLFDTFKAGLLEQKLAPRSINIVLMRLRELLRMAHQRGYLPEDRSPWVVKVRDSRPEIFPLSFEEKDRFIAALPLHWRPYFLVAFGTGLRPSEQIALKPDAIDWDRDKIIVREGWRKGQRTRLKTRASAREVDLLPAVRKALERQRSIAGSDELVFPNSRGGYININNLRPRIWYATLKRTGLRPRDLYNTRHTFATHALASGEDPGWVAKMLGHTTLLMLTTRYYSYIPNLTRKDGMLLARRLEERPSVRKTSETPSRRARGVRKGGGGS
jgi:integrase